MHKRVQSIGIMLLFVSLFMMLVACSDSESSGTGDGSKEKVLEMWTRESSELNVRAAVESFNAGDHGFTVKVKAIPNANFTDQFVSALASDTGPDILSIDLVFAPYFSSIGALKDITDFYDSLEFKDQLMDSMVHTGSFKGKQYAVPFSADVSALFYNKKHFKEAGLDPNDPPQTWDELKEVAKKLTTDDRYGYTFAGADVGGQVFTFLPYIWGNGGAVLSEDGTESLINSPEAIEALQFYVDLVANEKVTPEGVPNYSWSQSQDAFTSGKASMLITGNFFPRILSQDYPDLDWGLTLIPKNEGKNHSSFAGGELIAVPNSSKYVEEAKQFIEYVLSEQVQVGVFAKEGGIPVREDLFANKYFKEEPRYQVFTEALKVAETPYSIQYNEIFSQPVLSSIQRALKGEVSPQEAFRDAEKEINKILDSK
ncbi:ABC transporter substrate-binding protein [Radiobacillus deserti]|uniref:ABC transporter substrate-binding protein n=1 Tax=Radiobacillus deserti TaxID=2594883 RepID=A0A516KDJ7_9BACI|nr:ABC transporter substrate-binding protein [Radiobacillus deserti]QDP39469.1 ABC transporter substrate-binding protein [Radiobacillus deserti]